MRSSLAAAAALVVLFLMAGSALSVTFPWADIFSSGVEGQSITVSPHNWVASSPTSATLPVRSSLHSNWSTMAIDASGMLGSGGLPLNGTGIFYKLVDGISTTGVVYLTFKAWAVTSKSYCEIGFSRGNENLGAYLRFDGTRWFFDAGQVGGGSYYFGTSIGKDQTVLCKIAMNYTNNTTWAEIRAEDGTLLQTSSVQAASINRTCYGVVLRESVFYTAGLTDGLDVDDVAIYSQDISPALRSVFFYGAFGAGSQTIGGWEGLFDAMARFHFNFMARVAAPDTIYEGNRFMPQYYQEISDSAQPRGIYFAGVASSNSPDIVPDYTAQGRVHVEQDVDWLLSVTGNSPNLIGWYVIDEPYLSDASSVAAVVDIFQRKNPQRIPLFPLNNTARIPYFDSCSTVYWTDRYPLMTGEARDPWLIKDWCKTVSQYGSKRQWFAPPAFGVTNWWQYRYPSDYSFPSTEEYRLMVHLALANGTKALTPLGFQGWFEWVNMVDPVGYPNNLGTEAARLGEKLMAVCPLLLDFLPTYSPVVTVATIPTRSHGISVGSMGNTSSGPIYMIVVNEDLEYAQEGTATLPSAWISGDRAVYDLYSLAAVSAVGANTFSVQSLDPGDARIYMLGTAAQYATDRSQIITNQVNEALRVQGADRVIASRWGLNLSAYDAVVADVRSLLSSGQYDQALALCNGSAAQTLESVMSGSTALSACRSGLLGAQQDLGKAYVLVYAGKGITRPGQAQNATSWESLAIQYGDLRRNYLIGNVPGLQTQISGLHAQTTALRLGAEAAAMPWTENFNGATASQSIAAPPLSWGSHENPADVRVTANLHPGWTGNAIEGKQVFQNGVLVQNARHSWYKDVVGIPSLGTVRLDFKAWSYGQGQTTNCGMGFSRAFETTYMFAGGWWYYDNQWIFDARSIGGDLWYSSSGLLANATAQLGVVVDYGTNRIWGEIRDGSGTLLATTTVWTLTAAPPLYGVFLFEDNRLGVSPSAMDVDDVTISIIYGQISGTITLQDYVGNLNLAPVKVNILRQGEVVEEREFRLTQNPGSYTLNNVMTGVYDLEFSACEWLPEVVTSQTVTGGSPLICNVSLRNGDLDGDKSVTNTDLTSLLDRIDQVGDK